MRRAFGIWMLGLIAFCGSAAFAGQSGPFPQWKGRPSLFCPPGSRAEGLEFDDNSHERCVPCVPGTYSDGSDAWSLEACHLCNVGTYAGSSGATACDDCPSAAVAGATACDPGR